MLNFTSLLHCSIIDARATAQCRAIGEEHAGLTHSPQFKLLYLAHYQVLAALKELLEHVADHWVVSPLKEGTPALVAELFRPWCTEQC